MFSSSTPSVHKVEPSGVVPFGVHQYYTVEDTLDSRDPGPTRYLPTQGFIDEEL